MGLNSIPVRGYVFFSKTLRHNPVPPKPPVQGIPEALSPVLKRLQSDTDRRPLPY